MQLNVSTPALLFPAISLLFLAYTNRFLHLASLVRTLHRDRREKCDESVRRQIDNLRRRVGFIRWMQLFGAAGLIACVVSMVAILFEAQLFGLAALCIALAAMAASLVTLIVEVYISGGALQIMLDSVDDRES